MSVMGAALVVFAVLAAREVRAAAVPTGIQSYFVIGHEQHVWDMFFRVVDAESGVTLSDSMESVVAITASSDNQVVTYDHWEDGFETDITNPAQDTTQVLGNGDMSDGCAGYFTTGTCSADSDDVLNKGDTLTLNSTEDPGVACTPSISWPTEYSDLSCVVPVNPRVTVAAPNVPDDEIRFDGGDQVAGTGGPLVAIHGQTPTASLPNIITGATEMLSLQTVEDATSYSIPVGEDTFAGNNTTRASPLTSIELP